MDFHKSLFLLIFPVWHSLSFEISLRENSSNTTINTKLLLFLDHLCASTCTVTMLGVLCCCLSLLFIHRSRYDPHEERVDLLQAKPPHVASYNLDFLHGNSSRTRDICIMHCLDKCPVTVFASSCFLGANVTLIRVALPQDMQII